MNLWQSYKQEGVFMEILFSRLCHHYQQHPLYLDVLRMIIACCHIAIFKEANDLLFGHFFFTKDLVGGTFFQG